MVVIEYHLHPTPPRFVAGPWEWCRRFFETTPQATLLHLAFPFLDWFLGEAEAFWACRDQGRLRSGVWIQDDLHGAKLALEAEAVAAGGQRFLLLRLAAVEHAGRNRFLPVLGEARPAGAAAREPDGDLLAVVSHDIRTPLTAVLGFANLLLRGKAGDLTPSQSAYVANMNTAAVELLELVNDYLDYSRVRGGVGGAVRDWFDFAGALNEVLGVIGHMASISGISISRQLDGAGRVFADRRRLKQILYNLLSNAIRFTPAGGGVRIDARHEDGWFLVSVSDSGVGIAPEHLSRIFEKYYQVPGSNAPPGIRGGGGAGLGLAIVRALVAQHDGSIEATSQPGAGSCFTMRLPGGPAKP